MPDLLKVDLVAGRADVAIGKVEKYTATLKQSNAELKTLAGPNLGAGFDQQIAKIQHQAATLGLTLRKLGETSVNSRGIDGLGKAALRADADLRRAQERLREIDRQAAITRDPVLFTKLRAEAQKTALEFDRLQQKINRVAAGRAARPGARPGFGAGARGLVDSAAGLGVPFANEASIGIGAIEAAKGIGLSTAGLATFGAVAAAGYGIIKITEKIRDEAKKRLAVEESIAIAANKQILSGQENLKLAAAQSKEADYRRERNADIASRDEASLQRLIALSETLKRLDPSKDNVDKQQQTIDDAQSRSRQLIVNGKSAADAAFASRAENFKRQQEQEREFERKRIEAIRQGREKVFEFGKDVTALFTTLSAAKGDANPFVRVFTDAEAAIQQTRIATAALSKDLQTAAADMVAASNANNLFSARLDARLAANDLRGDARAFRDAGAADRPSVFDTARADLKAREAIEKFQRETASGLFRNSKNLEAFSAGASNKTKLDLFNFQRGIDESEGLFRNPKFDDERRRELSRPEDEVFKRTPTDRLDKQLAVIRGLAPENEFQRAEADRKIIALTQGLNPADLTDAQRNAAAAARENEAARLDGSEKAARGERVEAARVQLSIDKNIADLLKIAQSEGLTGVIRIINEAEDSAKESLSKRKRATAADAKDFMD